MDRLHRVSGFSFSRRSTPGSATNSHGSGASCRGCESRRTTASTPTRGRKPWASSSTAARKLLVYHFMFGPSYQAGCPVNWSMVDSVDGLLPHVHARDATVVFVSQPALKKLQAYRRRMGWSFPWSRLRAPTSTSTSASRRRRNKAARRPRRCPAPSRQSLSTTPARAAQTPVGYLTESPGFSTFVRDDGDVYQAYSTTWRGWSS